MSKRSLSAALAAILLAAGTSYGQEFQFKAPKTKGQMAPPKQEQCLLCHGPGRIAAIGEVHQR